MEIRPENQTGLPGMNECREKENKKEPGEIPLCA
jgi:hypothetical protein